MCISMCLDRQFLMAVGDRVCTRCDVLCQECMGSGNNCSKCISNGEY